MSNKFICSTNWCKESTSEETICFLTELAQFHIRESGPYQEALSKVIGSGDWRGVVDFNINYERGSPADLYHARQSLALFEKLECLPLGVDREEVAWNKFKEAEAKCQETNIRLRAARLDGFLTPSSVASVLFTAQRKIASVLGDVPTLDELNFAFGPGANTTVKARASSARWKLNAQPTCSSNCVGEVNSLLEQLPHYAAAHRSYSGLCAALEDHMDRISIEVQVSDGKLQFVPKNAKTFRSIVVEPLLNSVAQKGIGSYIKERLRKIGIDIEVQSERNKALACRSSVDRSLATIDLSSASDTISIEIVNELLPADWFVFLSKFRTGTVRYKDNQIRLHKFSSMGNAYTFELETLLFWALASAVTSVLRLDASEVSSFGDDIILPTEAVPLLLETLSYCGFSVNSEKSFWEGPFRESCGGDYVSGIDIRPHYQKTLISGQSLFILHNYYVRTLQFEAAAFVLSAIPESLRLWGPDGYGDGHLLGSWSHHARRTRRIRECDYGGVIFDTFSLKHITLRDDAPIGDRILPLYTIYRAQGSEPIDPYVVRGSKGYRRVSIYTLSTGVLLQ